MLFFYKKHQLCALQELIQFHSSFYVKNPQKQDRSTFSRSKTLTDVCIISLKIKRLQRHLQMTRFKQFPYLLKGVVHFRIEQNNTNNVQDLHHSLSPFNLHPISSFEKMGAFTTLWEQIYQNFLTYWYFALKFTKF